LILFIVGIATSSSQNSDISRSQRTYTTVYGDSQASNKILSIPVKGPIEGSQSGGGYSSIFADQSIAYGYDLKSELIEAANSREYSGVILELDSPGGTIYGAKAIADGIEYFKQKTGNPVFASIQGLAASGGFWAAVSADKIIADTGTGIGSIGVIYGPFTYYDKPLSDGNVITQNGIEQTYITAGEGKDAGNPFRRLTTKEQDVIQTSVNDAYDSFVSYVSQRRSISADTIKQTIGAHLYGEKQALKNKLIDEVASREVAYQELADAARVTNDFKIVSSHESSTDLLNLLGSQLQPNSSRSVARDPKKALVCLGEVDIPLAYHGEPASACKTN
jgi:protease-4